MTLFQSIARGIRSLTGSGHTGHLTPVIDPLADEMRRLARYRHNWKMYYGENLDAMRAEDGTPSHKVNYLKRNIDKINWFAFGHRYTCSHPRFQDELDVAGICWGSKSVERHLRMAQFGSVTGDCYLMVAPSKVAETIVKYNDKLADYEVNLPAQVKILPLPSEYVRPYYDAFDMDLLIKVEIRVPILENNAKGESVTRYFYMEITRETVRTDTLDAYGKVVTPGTTTPNPIGEIYVVHIRNYPGGDGLFGLDDITEVSALNEVYTEKLTDVGNIIAYHAAPITVVKGARAGNLQRGPNKIWGNLPKDADVSHLELDSDLEASNAFLARVKEGIHEMMGVPEIAQGSQQAISNTSGVALHTMYLPLIERAQTKQGLYGPMLLEARILALRWLTSLGLMRTISDDGKLEARDGRRSSLSEEDYDDIRRNTEMTFTVPLPKDRLIEAQIQTTLIQAKLQTRRDALVAMGERNPNRKITEIDAEQEKLAKAALKAQQLLDPRGPNPQPDAEATGDRNSSPEDGSAIQSGASAGQGESRTETTAQRGRPRGT